MAERRRMTIDGNEAAASVAHRLSEVIAIYPITPSSPMGEFADEWSAAGRRNVWGTVPQVVEMQSEGGAAGAVHGALQAGALTTTFTASQGLLLMVPNMYKIAGELTAYTMHVSARTVAAQALSIFGDHSDVMAVRQTGFALLASNSVQEAHDLAAVAHAAGLRARVPFVHFFDGFRTSHEVAKIEELTDEDLRALVDEGAVAAHRERALRPERPVVRGTAQNPDTFFQSREACSPWYRACPGIVAEVMEAFGALTGRRYGLFDYVGHPEAERVVMLMGSGADVAHEAVEYLAGRGEKVGLVKVRLYRPFSVEHLMGALPATVRGIAVLDRTKEAGAVGEPLYTDVVAALAEGEAAGWAPYGQRPVVVGGRYGLSSKDFTPAMVKAVLDNLGEAAPRNHFTVGITDDVSHSSLEVERGFDIEPDAVVRAVFWGLGADGTVGANKNSIKIIGEETDNYAQGYFVYDSKKSGGVTVSHLRFGPEPIRSSYQIHQASFVACHQFTFVDKYDVLELAAPGAVFLLNAPYGPGEVWEQLPREMQEQILEKKLRFYVIDAYEVAKRTGMGVRINTIMQTCFFAISGVLPREEAIAKIKGAIEKTYGKKGAEVVRQNFEAVDETLANLHEVAVPGQVTAARRRPPIVSEAAPAFVREVEAPMMALKGDEIPVSRLPADGTYPTGTTQWEKRNIALEIPVWDPATCIQCTKCSFVCPHATIRAKIYDPAQLEGAPAAFRSADAKGSDWKGKKFTLQVAPEDCTGCGLCVQVCPAKNKAEPAKKAIHLLPQLPLREQERENWAFFLSIPDLDPTGLKTDVKGSQLRRPLFEFSGACAGCGETPYVKLMTQLFGDRMLIANATGCSSIYGGNLPTTPYTVNDEGRGPAWSNSLFEDNAEFGLGFRLAIDKQREMAAELVRELAGELGEELVGGLLEADQSTEAGIAAQRRRVAALREALGGIDTPAARRLEGLADSLVRKSVWILGGDGWAYDIGYGGLDHVLALGRDVNILVVDTEVYSNTGGQMSKATPLGAAAKFAAAGKAKPKKDLGLMAMAYGDVYVARVAFGAKDQHTVKAFAEAESYPGTSLIIAYAHCIAHGYDLRYGCEQQQRAVDSGHWPLYRFDPRRRAQGDNPLQLDSKPPKIPLADYVYQETRYRMLQQMAPQRAEALLAAAQDEVRRRYALYEQLAHLKPGAPGSSQG
ncbi:MAG: pyruvate:ferredoxin (flavodoxin) oxidoreductase [Deferrisomatales bacterium]